MAKRRGGKGGGHHHRDPLKGIPKRVRILSRSIGRLQTAPALRDAQVGVRQVRAHSDTIDRAYDAYQARLNAIQAAQAKMVAEQQSQHLAMTQGLEEIGGGVTEQGAQEAQRRATLLGQGQEGVAAERQLGGAASAGRTDLAGIVGDAMANIGIAHYSDLSRRAATGERARISDQATNFDALQNAREGVADVRQQRADAVAAQIAQLLQAHKANKLAKFQAMTDRMSAEAQAQLAQKQFHLDQRGFRVDRRDTRSDNRRDRRQSAWERKHPNAGSGSSGSSGDHGLSPSEQQTRHHYLQEVNGAISKYRKLRKRGLSRHHAMNQAQSQTGVEAWMMQVAAAVVDRGGVSAGIRKAAAGHIPGSIPKAWLQNGGGGGGGGGGK